MPTEVYFVASKIRSSVCVCVCVCMCVCVPFQACLFWLENVPSGNFLLYLIVALVFIICMFFESRLSYQKVAFNENVCVCVCCFK